MKRPCSIFDNTPRGLPDDVLSQIVDPCLSVLDCVALQRVCKQWRRVFTNEMLNVDEKLYDHVVFDEKKWLQITGVISISTCVVDPELKKDYIKRLKTPCDMFNELDGRPHRFQNGNNRFWETRRVILIPEMINGELVNINRIGKILGFVKANKTGTAFYHICGRDTEEFRTRVSGKLKFLEVTLDVIPYSRGGNPLGSEAKLLKPKGYRAPSPLEAVICNLVLNLGKEKEFYFSSSQEGKLATHTGTNGLYQACPVIVGGASPCGLDVDYGFNCGDYNVGVVAVMEVLLNHGS